jgi:hypothetical protein
MFIQPYDFINVFSENLSISVVIKLLPQEFLTDVTFLK